MSKTIVLSDEDFKKVQEVLAKATPVVEKKKGVTIYKTDGSVLFESDEQTVRDAVIKRCEVYGANLSGVDLRGVDLSGVDLYGANLRGVDLSGVDLYGANLRGVELASAKFYGKGGTTKIKKSQLDDFMAALGIIVES